MIKRLTSLFFLSLLLTFIVGCSKNSSDDNLAGDWIRKSDFDGVSRSGSFAFVINDKAYVGAGYNSTNDTRLQDMWMYDSDLNGWTKMADFPGVARNSAVAFAANGKGYVGLGTTDGAEGLKDFWEYNPGSNTWTRIADFPTDKGRFGALAYAVNNVGYVGFGNDGDNDQKDIYKYTGGAWTKVDGFPGSKRIDAFSFVIDNKAYIGGGWNNGINVNDFWVFDGSANTWTKLHSLYPDGDTDDIDVQGNDDYNYNLQRHAAVAFAISGNGYLTTGTQSSFLTTTWQYLPGTDIWKQVDTFEGSSREAAVGFTLKDKGYVATGRSGTTRFDDLWQFDPNASDDD